MLTIQDIAFERNHQILFDRVNMTLSPGELLQVQGANGSGKSTLLRIIAGLIEPHQGNIFWKNKTIAFEKEQYQQHLHYLGHQTGLKLNLTVHENIQLYNALSSNKKNAVSVQYAIEQMNLDHLRNTPAYHLSAGQLRRLSLTRLILKTVPLWILDEPMTALDANGQKVLTELLNQHLANNGIAVLAAHQDYSVGKNVKSIYLENHNA